MMTTKKPAKTAPGMIPCCWYCGSLNLGPSPDPRMAGVLYCAQCNASYVPGEIPVTKSLAAPKPKQTVTPGLSRGRRKKDSP